MKKAFYIIILYCFLTIIYNNTNCLYQNIGYKGKLFDLSNLSFLKNEIAFLESFCGFDLYFRFFAPKVSSSYYVEYIIIDKNKIRKINFLDNYCRESSVRLSTLFMDFHSLIDKDKSIEYQKSLMILNQLGKFLKNKEKGDVYLNVYIYINKKLTVMSKEYGYVLIYSKKI